MEINIQDIVSQCMDQINSKVKNLKRLNIIIAGKTGVGKSTVINYIFREQLAETGIGRPVTQHMKMITKKDFPLTIYDTKGLELGRETQKEIKKEIIDKIKECLYTKDENQCIHCIWYCINTASDRIEDSEIEWIKEFAEENKETHIPIIIVLTKSFSKKKAAEFRSYIDNLNLDVCAIVPLLALDYEIDEYTVNAYGADNLIEVMGELLGDELLFTLQNVQKAAIKQKVKYAQGIVATAATAGFAEGFSPIPFSDAALLIPTQITMFASITAVFGLNLSKGTISTIVSSLLGSSGATIAGKTIVANVLKLVPGAGTALGGVISGSTAAILTTALGEAYIKILEKICNGEIKQDEISDEKVMNEMKKDFKTSLKEKKSK